MVTYLEFLTRLPFIPHHMLLAHSCFPFCGKKIRIKLNRFLQKHLENVILFLYSDTFRLMFEMTTLGKYVDLSENYVELLDSDEDLIENYVDLTNHYINLSDVK